MGALVGYQLYPVLRGLCQCLLAASKPKKLALTATIDTSPPGHEPRPLNNPEFSPKLPRLTDRKSSAQLYSQFIPVSLYIYPPCAPAQTRQKIMCTNSARTSYVGICSTPKICSNRPFSYLTRYEKPPKIMCTKKGHFRYKSFCPHGYPPWRPFFGLGQAPAQTNKPARQGREKQGQSPGSRRREGRGEGKVSHTSRPLRRKARTPAAPVSAAGRRLARGAPQRSASNAGWGKHSP